MSVLPRPASRFDPRRAVRPLLLPAGALPCFDRLRAGGVRPDDRVPYDCQAWFSVRPAGDPSRDVPQGGPPTA